MEHISRTLTSADMVQPESTRLCTNEVQSFIESIRKLKKKKEEKYKFWFYLNWNKSKIFALPPSNATTVKFRGIGSSLTYRLMFKTKSEHFTTAKFKL